MTARIVFLAGALACVPFLAAAQASPAGPDAGRWQFAASAYGYLPSVSGHSNVPADSGGTPININMDQLLDKLDFAFMGAFDAHNGRYGFFTDVVYLSFKDAKQQSRDFTIGQIGLPATTAAGFEAELQGLAWTVAGQYRLASNARLTADALAGVRLFDLRTKLDWNITGDIGPLDPSSRTGSAEVDSQVVDGIVGVKGRVALGDSGRWFVPFYFDVGTGESDLTWQAAGGVGYAFKWGELLAMWRHLAYEFKPGQRYDKVSFDGPMIGATFRW